MPNSKPSVGDEESTAGPSQTTARRDGSHGTSLRSMTRLSDTDKSNALPTQLVLCRPQYTLLIPTSKVFPKTRFTPLKIP
eukprot:1718640-Amphidinium_carterae.2